MSLGSELQKARESKKITLEFISVKTRIPLKYLEALESDQFDVFPSQTHAKGFIRAVAKVTNQDSAPLIALFKSQVEPAAVKIIPPHPENEAPAGLSIPFLKKRPAPIRRERIQDEDFDPDLEPEEPGQTGRRMDKAQPRPSKSFRKFPWGRVLSRAFLILLAAGGVYWLGPSLARIAKQWHWPALSSSAPSSEPQTAALPGFPVKDKYQHLILKGLDQSWILVTMDDGQSSSEIDLAPGAVKTYRALRDFKLKIGNAGGVDVSLNGKPLGVLGVTGQVVEINLPDAELSAGGS
jgi:cytoskeleton protein RodZ